MVRDVKKRRLLFGLLFCFFCLPNGAFSAEKTSARHYDVVIAGAGTGGTMAAVQAARLGVRVALVEQSDWVGGQMTGAAVSTMDDLGSTRFGLYKEFIDRVKLVYYEKGRSVGICLWGSDTIGLEPIVGQEILLSMLKDAGSVDLFLRSPIQSAKVDGHALKSITIDFKGEPLELRGAVFIDATEYGDLLPLTGARYRAGNSISPKINQSANIQDITYVAVIKEYPQGLPKELRVTSPPPHYDKYVEKFRGFVTLDGNTFPDPAPFDVPSHNAYRAIPNPENSAFIDGGVAYTWKNISKTGLNSANDYPGKGGALPGMPVRYLEDRAYRAEQEQEAMLKTLSFLWYLQNELKMENWSVDTGQGYGGWFSNDWSQSKKISAEYAPILRHFPPFPYVREGRRLVGVETLTAKDIKRDPKKGRALRNYPTALALGEYPVDIHGSHLEQYIEHDLGETGEDFPKQWIGHEGVFQLPFEIFIPEKIDGLVAAEKNLSVSRMVNGAIRLHPITMHSGQAAGTIAAVAAQKKIRPRDVNPFEIQQILWDGGVRLSMGSYEDVPPDSHYWKAVQWATLYCGMDGIQKGVYGAILPLKPADIRPLLAIAFPSEKFDFPGGEGGFITRDDLLTLFADRFPLKIRAFWPEGEDMEALLLRGEAAAIFYELAAGGFAR